MKRNLMEMEGESLSKYIEIDADKRFGRPIIRGTRIGVYDVLGYMSSGMSQLEIIADFPELNEEKIKACLEFVSRRRNHLQVA